MESTLTAEQQEARKGRITSTRIVRLVNGRAWDVWADMAGLATVKDNARMRFGRKLERAIIEAAAEDRMWSPVRYQPGTVVRGDYATSPDAYVGDDPERIIEAKNRGAEQAKKYEGDEATPEEIIQAAWHMLVTGIPAASVAVLLGGNDLRIFDQARDPEMEAGLREVADRFLTDYWKPGRPPPMDASDAAAEYLRAKFPTHTAPLLVADDVATEWMAELRHALTEAEKWGEEAEALKNKIKAVIGDAEGLAGPLGRVTWKATKGTRRTDWERLARSYDPAAETIARFTEEKPGARRFVATWKEQ